MPNRPALVYGLGSLGVAAAAVLALDHWTIGDPPAVFMKEGFKRTSIITPPGRMTYYEAGSGKPLIFLHGIGGGASSWTWSKVAPAFASEHRVIVPDWVGWGYSEHPARFVGFRDYVDALEALIDHVGGPVTVVAQSLSAGFAMALAERRPGLIGKLILNTPSGGRDFGGNAFGPLARAFLTPFAKLSGVNFFFYKGLFHRSQFIGGWLRQEGFLDASAVSRDVVDGFLYSARQPNAAWSAIPFATGDLRYDLAPYLQRMDVPAAIFWGMEETQVGPDVRSRLQRLRPDIPLHLIERTKACPELERPDAVISIIQAALGERSGSSHGAHSASAVAPA